MTDSPAPPPTRDRANVVAFPPAVFLGAFAAGFVAHMLVPLGRLPDAGVLDVAAAALIAVGASLLGWAALTLRRARTAIYPGHSTTTIVTTGPYRLTRNPMYVSLTMIYAGTALAIRGVWPLATLIPCLLIVRYGIVGREESYLTGKFGQDYLAYTREVRRWLAVLICASLPSVFAS